jgi:U3 small nucleolar RNA-associated protein 19
MSFSQRDHFERFYGKLPQQILRSSILFPRQCQVLTPSPLTPLTHSSSLRHNPESITLSTLYSILSYLLPLLPPDGTLPEMYTPVPQSSSILLPSSYKVAFQRLWLAHLHHPLPSAELKNLLLIVHKRIIPYMNKPQLLMDWLTDSYNAGISHTLSAHRLGGSISLLALNGLWELMQKHNLDYPLFYVKLYALFTPTLFHTRYLARFIRLSDLFLSST